MCLQCGGFGVGEEGLVEQAGSEHRGIVGLTNACGMKSVGDGSFWTYEWG